MFRILPHRDVEIKPWKLDLGEVMGDEERKKKKKKNEKIGFMVLVEEKIPSTSVINAVASILTTPLMSLSPLAL
jgi:hypothetical protein